MPYVTLSLGLTIKVPTNGTRNWGTEIYAQTWTKISNHNHEGSGTGVQLDGSAALEANSIPTSKLSMNYGHTQAATVTPAGTTQTTNLNLGNVQKVDLGSASGTVTLTVSNPAAGCHYWWIIVQGLTPRDITWPAAFKWPGGVAPLLTEMSDDQIAVVEAYYDGTVYLGKWELNHA